MASTSHSRFDWEPSEVDDEALRADVRLLGGMLGDTLRLHCGEALFQRVEQVRALALQSGEAVADLLFGVDLVTAAALVRAFTMFFHLANTAEQVHRGRALRARQEVEGSWLAGAVDRIVAAGVAPGEVDEVLARLRVQPVFTAHPTEASRRSILSKLRRVADLLECSASVARDRNLAATVDLLWQTDELRRNRPEPIDEARSTAYYLDQLAGSIVPAVVEDLSEGLDVVPMDVADGLDPPVS
jgi:phosphoenolpyruvate carboxylase